MKDHVRVLQSVDEITRQRDVESLEFSLVVAMAKLIPCHEIVLYRCGLDKGDAEVEEVVRYLKVEDGETVDEKCFTGAGLVSPEVAFAGVAMIPPYALGHSPIDADTLVVPVCSDNELIGSLRITGADAAVVKDGLIGAIVRIYGNYLVVLNQSQRDKLTGLLNRQSFERRLGRLLAVQREQQEQYAQAGREQEFRKPPPGIDAWLAVVDVDHFKRINDTYGHVGGDEVLLQLSRTMRHCFRRADLLFRFGGEEFVIVLEPLPDEAVVQTVERFRETVAATELPGIGHVTLSLGYARLGVSDYPQTVIECADRALYYAKQNGRNRACNHHQLVADGQLEEHKLDTAIDLF